MDRASNLLNRSLSPALSKREGVLLSLLLLSGVFLLTSCDTDRIYEYNEKITDQSWDTAQKVVCVVNVTDTITPTAFYINVRHTKEYGFSNLYMFIRTDFPGGKKHVDTLECILADGSYKWLGKGIGDIYDYQIPFKKGVRFPKSGRYIFTLTQAMRNGKDPVVKLAHVTDVGMRIEKMH